VERVHFFRVVGVVKAKSLFCISGPLGDVGDAVACSAPPFHCPLAHVCVRHVARFGCDRVLAAGRALTRVF
jgi:hypothetical protein